MNRVWVKLKTIIIGFQIRANWDFIVKELRNRIPDIDIPDVDQDWWEKCDPYLLGFEILIPIKKDSDYSEWEVEKMNHLLEVITDLFGEIPDGVQVKFLGPMGF